MGAGADGWFAPHHDGTVALFVRVTPNASADRIEGVETRADGVARLRIRVRAIPDRGRANTAVIELIAKALRVPKAEIGIAAGHTARDKTLRITWRDGLMENLSTLAAPSAN